jgi:hypothetical protein
MPVFARSPAAFVLETGEVAALVSEPSQRSRGIFTLRDSTGGRVFINYENPTRGERLVWFALTVDGKTQKEPAVTPVLVREFDADKKTLPTTIRYLRHAQSLEAVYFPETKEVHLYYWANLFSPLKRNPTAIACHTISLSPSDSSNLGDFTTYPDLNNPLHLAVSKIPEQAQDFPLNVGSHGKPIHGILAIQGSLNFKLSLNNSYPEPSLGMKWRGATLEVVLARRNPPQDSWSSLNLPRSLLPPPPPSPPPSPPLPPSPPTIAQDPTLNGPYLQGNPQAVVRLSATVTIADKTYPVQWIQTPSRGNSYVLEVPPSPTDFAALQIYQASVRFQEEHALLDPQLTLTIDPPSQPSGRDSYVSLYLTAISLNLNCSTAFEGTLDQLYSGYRRLPIPYTLPLPPGEPHATPQKTADPYFNVAVGDLAEDPGGGWPGIYNQTALDCLLQVGASTYNRAYDPLQETDAHRRLPSTPGLIQPNQIQERAALITMKAVEDQLIDHTNHQYFQRELEDLPSATRVLMYARGSLIDLHAEEQTPPPDFDTTETAGLIIGAAELIPAILGEQYKGENFITLESSKVLFPFDVPLPGFISILPGEVGHQFLVSGGSPPYTWCLRRTRSSASDPARRPNLPTGDDPPPPYPFTNDGNLVDPLPAFPEATQGGGLPPGMLLDRQGLLYGTPSLPGTYLFRLHVKDATNHHAETTVKLLVLNDHNDPVSCSTPRVTPIPYKATVASAIIPPIPDAASVENWRAYIGAVGGETGQYFFTFTNPFDSPRQQVPVDNTIPVLNLNITSGQLSAPRITSDNFQTLVGIWLFEIQVTESLPSGSSDLPTCDRRAVAVSIGTARVAGESDQTTTVSSASYLLPEGNYQPKSPVRTHLILDPPVPVRAFVQGKNTSLRGSPGFNVRPDIGLNLRPGPITGTLPGIMNPVAVVGTFVDTQSPSHYQLDWSASNPTDYYRDMVDRFIPALDSLPPPPGPPPPPDSVPARGATIDDMIPTGKRIRPLWPI